MYTIIHKGEAEPLTPGTRIKLKSLPDHKLEGEIIKPCTCTSSVLHYEAVINGIKQFVDHADIEL